VRGDDESGGKTIKKALVKKVTTGILLNNMGNRDILGLGDTLRKVLYSPQNLRWIDLSHNYLTTLVSDFNEFP
jgi:hypothetical protein